MRELGELGSKLSYELGLDPLRVGVLYRDSEGILLLGGRSS
jgi:hypothetical protein